MAAQRGTQRADLILAEDPSAPTLVYVTKSKILGVKRCRVRADAGLPLVWVECDPEERSINGKEKD